MTKQYAVMKKYVAPHMEVYSLQLEMSFAASSAKVYPSYSDDEGIQESWDNEIFSDELEW